MQRLKATDGLTVIELMVILIIISIVAVIVYAAVQS